MEVLANVMVVIILHYVYQINVLYTLNLHNDICQLYLSKAGKIFNCKKEKKKRKKATPGSELASGHNRGTSGGAASRLDGEGRHKRPGKMRPRDWSLE